MPHLHCSGQGADPRTQAHREEEDKPRRRHRIIHLSEAENCSVTKQVRHLNLNYGEVKPMQN